MNRDLVVPVPHQQAEEASMRWQSPRMIEIACGCEINAYFPADL